MPRTKIRNYPSCKQVETELENYLRNHRGEYEHQVLQKLGYEDLNSLQEADQQMKFGFNCGWVQLHPKNKEMAREWRLDNDGLPNCIFDIGSVIIPTQCCTIKEIIVEKLVNDLDLSNEYEIITKLD